MKVLLFNVVVIIFVLGLSAVSCKPALNKPTEVTVSAAASLKEAFEELAKEFEVTRPELKVVLNFAGSQSLRMQIEQGAQVDVFASANYEHLAALVKSGHVVSDHKFAENGLVVVTPSSDERLKEFEDLAKAQRLVLGGPEVPVGRYSDAVIAKAGEKLGKEFSEKVISSIASRENNVRLALSKIVLGEADAALVYRTDAISAGDRVRIVEIPQEFNVLASYYIGTTTVAPAGTNAQDFVDLVMSETGKDVLSKYGFQSNLGAQKSSESR